MGFGQCDQIGQNFAYFLLNQFSPNQALSSRDQETPWDAPLIPNQHILD